MLLSRRAVSDVVARNRSHGYGGDRTGIVTPRFLTSPQNKETYRRRTQAFSARARPAAVIATKRWLREEYNYRLQVGRTNPNFSNDFKQEKIRARARPLHEQNIRDAG